MRQVESSESVPCEGRVYENQGLLPLIDLIAGDPTSLLDVGCGAGANMALLRERGLACIGLTISSDEAAACSARGLRVVVADAGRDLPFAAKSFDGILLSHLVEHMADPSALLDRVRRLLADDGHLYVAIPNVVYYKQRLEFMMGRFRYRDSGLLDSTHLRFFDRVTAARLLTEAGFEIEAEVVDGGVPSLGLRSRMPGAFASMDRMAMKAAPGLFGFQFIFRARPS